MHSSQKDRWRCRSQSLYPAPCGQLCYSPEVSDRESQKSFCCQTVWAAAAEKRNTKSALQCLFSTFSGVWHRRIFQCDDTVILKDGFP